MGEERVSFGVVAVLLTTLVDREAKGEKQGVWALVGVAVESVRAVVVVVGGGVEERAVLRSPSHVFLPATYNTLMS